MDVCKASGAGSIKIIKSSKNRAKGFQRLKVVSPFLIVFCALIIKPFWISFVGLINIKYFRIFEHFVTTCHR